MTADQRAPAGTHARAGSTVMTTGDPTRPTCVYLRRPNIMQAIESLGFTVGSDGTFKRTARPDVFHPQAGETVRFRCAPRARTHARRHHPRLPAVERGGDRRRRRAENLAHEVKQRLVVLEAANEAERNGQPVPDPDVEAARRAARRSGITPTSSEPLPPAAGRPRSPRWADMFPAVAHATSPWESTAEFLSVVASGRGDARLQMQAAVMKSSDGPLGLVVPDQMAVPGSIAPCRSNSSDHARRSGP